MRGGGNFRRVAEAYEPMHIRFPAKPSELALGEAARGLLDLLSGFFLREVPRQMFAPFGVTDKLKRLHIRRDAAPDQARDFFDPACLNHGIDACVDASVESFAGRKQAYF